MRQRKVGQEEQYQQKKEQPWHLKTEMRRGSDWVKKKTMEERAVLPGNESVEARFVSAGNAIRSVSGRVTPCRSHANCCCCSSSQQSSSSCHPGRVTGDEF